MTQHRSLILAVAVVCLPTILFADWDVREGPSDLIAADFAFGVSEAGQSLNVFCNDGVPTVMAWGYPARTGPERAETLQIITSSGAFSVAATHSPPDGLWVGAAQGALVDALRNDRVATLIPMSASDTVEISLAGSARAISRVLSDCGNATAIPPDTAAVATTTPNLAQIEADITATCGGPYTLDDAALLTGFIDSDASPDFVLDWAGVTCQDPGRGRGAGNCGINMCQISVILSERDNEVILGLGPELIADAFGRVRLKTVALRPSCPEDALDCVFMWNLTENGLDAVPVIQ